MSHVGSWGKACLELAERMVEMARYYLGVRYEGEIHRFTTFNLKGVLELSGGFLPPFVSQYHFQRDRHGDPVRDKRWVRYISWPAVRHADGIALGAFSAEAVMGLSRQAQDAAFRWGRDG